MSDPVTTLANALRPQGAVLPAKPKTPATIR